MAPELLQFLFSKLQGEIVKFVQLFYVSLWFIVSFYTTSAAAALLAPSALKAAASSSSQISLSWNDNSDSESGFIVQRSLRASSGFQEIAKLPEQSKSYMDSGLKAGTTYFYRVRAYRVTRKQTINRSAFSNVAYAMTLAVTPNPTPSPTPVMTPKPTVTPTPTPVMTPMPTATPVPPTPTPVVSNPNDSCPLLAAEQQKYPNANVKSALDYGLKGDGVTDEYEALQKIAADMSGKQFTQRQIVYFPKGTYYINRYIRTGAQANGNRPITYRNASNFSLIGCAGAIISVKGDFELLNDIDDGFGYRSTMMQMQAFRFESSSNFKLSGFEINGNVNRMTRQQPAGKMLSETFSHGVVTSAAKNYEISHVKSHHFAGDGFYVGDSMTVDDGGIYDNVEAYNNARQGMSVIQGRNLLIKNSIFRHTGFTDGSYPGHAPKAGVDIEPNWGPEQGSSYTENIVFDNCKFLNNQGSQFVGGDNGERTYNVTVKNSQIEGIPSSTWPYVVIMSLPGGVLENNKINTYNGMVVPSFSGGMGDITKTNTIVRGNTITSSGVGLQVLDAGAQVKVENNIFISAHTPSSYGPFPNVEAGAISFTGNKLSYPSANFGSKSVVGVIKVPSFSGNTIETDSTSRSYTIRISPGMSAAGNTIGPNILLSP